MKVYVVMTGYDYEGDELQSVWATKELAEQECERLGKSDKQGHHRAIEMAVRAQYP